MDYDALQLYLSTNPLDVPASQILRAPPTTSFTTLLEERPSAVSAALNAAKQSQSANQSSNASSGTPASTSRSKNGAISQEQDLSSWSSTVTNSFLPNQMDQLVMMNEPQQRQQGVQDWALASASNTSTSQQQQSNGSFDYLFPLAYSGQTGPQQHASLDSNLDISELFTTVPVPQQQPTQEPSVKPSALKAPSARKRAANREMIGVPSVAEQQASLQVQSELVTSFDPVSLTPTTASSKSETPTSTSPTPAASLRKRKRSSLESELNDIITQTYGENAVTRPHRKKSSSREDTVGLESIGFGSDEEDTSPTSAVAGGSTSAAAERRRRNTQASQRFRLRKKQKERAMETLLSNLKKQNLTLEGVIHEIRGDLNKARAENEGLKNMGRKIVELMEMKGKDEDVKRLGEMMSLGIVKAEVRDWRNYGQEEDDQQGD